MKKFLSLFLSLVFIHSINTTDAFAQNNENEENTINIAMSTDENYVYQLIVSMTSILENKEKNTKLKFHILLSGDCTINNKEKILSLQNKYKNCHIDLVDMGNSFDYTVTKRKSFTAAYYRLTLPSLFPKLNKILYLDADTIIMEDLSELYNTDITNYYVAGVRGYWVVTNNPEYHNIIGIKSLDQYINSGVLLMNLDAMRKNNVEDKFEQYIKKNHSPKNRIGKYHDQDVINYACYDKILKIPLKYNAAHSCLYDFYCVKVHKWDISLFNNIKDFYGKKEWEEAVKSPTIIHFLGSKHRPWNTPIQLPASLVWWKYAKKTDFFNEIVNKFRTRQNSYDMNRMINMEL